MSARVSPAPYPHVVLQLPTADAKAIDALFIQLGRLERELAHARETAARRGDDASEERVLDLECEHHCQAERIVATFVKMLAPKVRAVLHSGEATR